MIIGFDHRRNSKLFAQTAAKVFQSYGHKVRLFPSIVPTPFVRCAIQCFKNETETVGLGVMITASHNPKGDNGYKVYGENGAQIQDETAKKISEFIATEKINFFNLQPSPSPNDKYDKYDKDDDDEDLMVKVKNWYIKKLREWLELFPKPTIHKFRFVYTGLHGVGAIYLDEIFKSIYPDLENAYVHVEDQRFPDSEFSTVEFPNPEEGLSTLKLAIARAEALGIDTIFANDPDADRFCVAQKSKGGTWKIFNGNEIAVLLADFIGGFGGRENEKIAILGSCVSSRFLGHFCAQRKWKYEATLTGFKNLGNRGLELKEKEGFKVILAYEEAIGFQVGDWNFDKDGLSTLMTFFLILNNGGCEGINDVTDNPYNNPYNITDNNPYNNTDNPYNNTDNSNSISLNEKLNQIYKREECWPLQYNGYYFCKPASRIKPLLNKASALIVNKEMVWSINNRAKDIEIIIDTNNSNSSSVITLEFGMEGLGRAWLMLRSSGTEPKLKFYTELLVMGREQLSDDMHGVEENLKEAVEDIINELLEPEKNNLIKKK